MLFPCRLTPASLCALAFGIAVSHTAISRSVPPFSVEETITPVTARASDAESSRGTIETATQMAAATGQLPGLMLKFGLNNVSINGPDQFSISRDFITMRSISVVREFIRGDKRHTKAARLKAEAASAEAQRAAGLINVQRDAVGMWLDHWYAK